MPTRDQQQNNRPGTANANNKIFVQLPELGTVYQLDYSRIVTTLASSDKAKRAKSACSHFSSNNASQTCKIYLVHIQAELELKSGIPANILSIHKSTGEKLDPEIEIFDYLQKNKVLHSKIDLKWLSVVKESHDRLVDDPLMIKYFVEKFNKYQKIKKIADNARRRTSNSENSHPYVQPKNSDTEKISEICSSSKLSISPQPFPNCNIETLIFTILLITARQVKSRMFDFLLEENSEFFKTNFISQAPGFLNQVTVFNRTILHLVAATGNVTHLHQVFRMINKSGNLNVSQQDINGKTALDVAIDNGHHEVGRILWLQAWEESGLTMSQFISNGNKMISKLSTRWF